MNLSERIIALHRDHRIASHLLFWLLVLALQLRSADYFNPATVSFCDILLAVGTNLIAQMAAAYFLTYFIVGRYINKPKYAIALIWFVVSVYVICVLSRLEVVHVEEPFFGVKANPRETYTEIFTDLPKLMYVYFFRIYSVAFVFMLLKSLKDQLAAQRHALFLEKQKAEAELKLLKTQLNPHFLFNTLNNIYSLALTNSPVTADAIGRLSDILDHILYHCDSFFVPLSGEITLLQNYISLEKLRYDERLTVNFDSDVQKEVFIAPLILLSIVENAFKHGAGNDIGDPRIDIALKAADSGVEFTVSNSFQPRPTAGPSSIGLLNLKQQLGLIYPGKHLFELRQTDNMFTVTLIIRLQ